MADKSLRFSRDIADLEASKFNSDGGIFVAPSFDSRDAFGLQRVSQQFGVFDSKQVGDSDPEAWDTIVTGAGSSVLYTQETSSSVVTAGSSIGDRAVRQSRFYFPYVPGRSHAITLTGTFGSAVSGYAKRIGYFDDNDGIFFEQGPDGIVYCVIRSSTSGSVVDTKFAQSDWNLDKLDGITRHSIAELDVTKSQIFLIDFQWLGAGDTRFGISINGHPHYVHVVNHANITAGVYMKTPTLPVRYEVVNVSGSTSAGLESICSTVVSEGGYDRPGFEFDVSNGINVRTLSARTPILAIRMKSQFNGEDNRRTAKLLVSKVFGDADAFWELRHVHDPSAVTANFVSAGTNSCVEYSTDITSITATISHQIDSGYITANVGGRANTQRATSFITRHSKISRNAQNTNSQYLVIYVTPLTGTTDAGAGISWVEFS